MINTMPNQQQHPHTRSHAGGEPYEQQPQNCNNNNTNIMNNNNNTSTNNNNHHHGHLLKTGDLAVVPHVGPNQQKRPAPGDVADSGGVAPRAKRRNRKRPAVQLAAVAQQQYRYDETADDARRGEAHAVALLRMRCERMDSEVTGFASANDVAGAELIAAAFGAVAGGMESNADTTDRDEGKNTHQRSGSLYHEDDGADMYDAEETLDRCEVKRPADGAKDAGGGSADEEVEDNDEHGDDDEDDDDVDGNVDGGGVGVGRRNEDDDEEMEHTGKHEHA